jgi:DnaJ-class molecular chaperone
MTTTKTIYKKTAEPCRRCKGSGEYSHGFCFRCGGHGHEVVAVEVPMTTEEIAAAAEYQRGQDAHAAREAARKARMAARKAT